MSSKEYQEICWSTLTHFNDKQLEAEQAVKTFKYILYGGAMGGGKSYWLRWMAVKLLLQFFQKYNLKGVRVGLFCEDFPSLNDRHISKMNYELPVWLGQLNKGDKEYVLRPEYGSGVIALRNLDDPSKYASSEFASILVDELTRDRQEVFNFLRTRMRWPGISDTKFLSGTNPGGIGHAWVKKIFIDREFESTEKEQDKFKYIIATAYDNRANLPETYFDQLQGLPDEMRRAYLEGDWNLFEGQYFSEWRDHVHVVSPFPVPKTWRRFGAYDHGRAKPACFKWYAIDYDGNVWVYRELYVNQEDGSPRWEANQIASEVTRITKEANEVLEYVVVDSAIFTRTGTDKSIAEIFKDNGVGNSTSIPVMIPSDKSGTSQKQGRLHGWTIMHQYLFHDEHTLPKIRYFSTCVDSIRTIPSLVYNPIGKGNPEDLDSDGEDHAADVDRYFLRTLNDDKADKPPTREEIKQREFQKKIGVFNSDLVGLQRFNV